jgi:hypothetical protein
MSSSQYPTVSFGGRLKAAWACLRGKSVLQGIEIKNGSVRVTQRGRAYMGASHLVDCTLLTPILNTPKQIWMREDGGMVEEW